MEQNIVGVPTFLGTSENGVVLTQPLHKNKLIPFLTWKDHYHKLDHNYEHYDLICTNWKKCFTKLIGRETRFAIMKSSYFRRDKHTHTNIQWSLILLIEKNASHMCTLRNETLIFTRVHRKMRPRTHRPEKRLKITCLWVWRENKKEEFKIY